MGFACLVVAVGGVADGAELRSLETRPTSTGAVVRVELSAPVRTDLHAIPASPEPASRVYLDLPRGTRVAPGVARIVEGVAPVSAVRVGVGDRGVVRVVVDVESPERYELTRDGAVLALAITKARVAEPPPPTMPAKEVGPPLPLVRGPVVTASATRPPVAPLPLVSAPKIVLDPGHGGHDPGAQGYAVEKDVTLAIAKRLATILHERLGATAILTRTDDATLALADRTARANAEGADLFVSIHTNASPGGRLHGVETYYLNNTADRATIRLAAMENGLSLPGPVPARADLRYILSDLVQVGKMEESIGLASAVQRGLVGHLRRRYSGVTDLGVKQGPFYVLVGAYMPCILVETSFLTHRSEGRRLATAPYRDAVAEGLYTGIARFLADAGRTRTL